MGGILYWLIVVGERIAGRLRRADDYSRMSVIDVTRKIRLMGDMSQLPGESFQEWMVRTKPMRDVYTAWSMTPKKARHYYQPGEQAMQNLSYGTGNRDEALAELLAAGFAERAPNGEIVINKRGSDLDHQIRMRDR
jgi:hypothetical protein